MSSVNSTLSNDKYSTLSNERYFSRVGGKHLEHMPLITDIFNRVLTPLYGSQEKALEQIRLGVDRKCYLLFEENTPVGVLVFKTELSNEFAEFGIQQSIEIKSLFVYNSFQNSGRGLGSALVDQLMHEIHRLHLNPAGMHVTVNGDKKESLNFFQKKGFEIKHTWKDKYQVDATEYLLFCPLKLEENQRELQNRIQKFSCDLAISDEVPFSD